LLLDVLGWDGGGILNGRRKPNVPREKERIGGTKVDEKRDAAWRIVPSPPKVIIASTVRCNSP
jgi:hypothetical protein